MNSTLKELGLTDKEIVVYLALLSAGQTSASILAYKTAISASTIHYLCQRLEEKGLLKSSRKGNVIYYAPEAPEKILYILEEKKQEICEKQEAVQRIIVHLKTLMDPECLLPKVAFGQGEKEVMKSQEDFFGRLAKGGVIHHFFSPKKDRGNMIFTKKIIKFYDEMQIKYEFKHQCICVDSVLGKHFQEDDHCFNRETRLVSSKNYGTSAFSMIIAEDAIFEICFSEKGAFSTTLQHMELAEMHRNLFLLAWDKIKK